MRNNPVPNGPLTVIKDCSTENMVRLALSSDFIILELEHNDL